MREREREREREYMFMITSLDIHELIYKYHIKLVENVKSEE